MAGCKADVFDREARRWRKCLNGADPARGDGLCAEASQHPEHRPLPAQDRGAIEASAMAGAVPATIASTSDLLAGVGPLVPPSSIPAWGAPLAQDVARHLAARLEGDELDGRYSLLELIGTGEMDEDAAAEAFGDERAHELAGLEVEISSSARTDFQATMTDPAVYELAGSIELLDPSGRRIASAHFGEAGDIGYAADRFAELLARRLDAPSGDRAHVRHAHRQGANVDDPRIESSGGIDEFHDFLHASRV